MTVASALVEVGRAIGERRGLSNDPRTSPSLLYARKTPSRRTRWFVKTMLMVMRRSFLNGILYIVNGYPRLLVATMDVNHLRSGPGAGIGT